MSPAWRERHPSVMPFACNKRSVETLFFSAMASQSSPSLTTYLPPPHAEELPSEGLFDAAVSAAVEELPSEGLVDAVVPAGVEELPSEELLDPAVSPGVEGVVTGEDEGCALSTSSEADPVVPDGF